MYVRVLLEGEGGGSASGVDAVGGLSDLSSSSSSSASRGGGNAAWGFAFVVAPIAVAMLLLRFRSAVEGLGSRGASKRHGRRQSAPSSREVEGFSVSLDPPVYELYRDEGAAWSRRHTLQLPRNRRDSRCARSSSLEDFRHDVHSPGDPDRIWRSNAYSF